jgi:hypothetical protein
MWMSALLCCCHIEIPAPRTCIFCCFLASRISFPAESIGLTATLLTHWTTNGRLRMVA